MDAGQWLLLTFAVKFGLLVCTFLLAGLCLVKLQFRVYVSIQLRLVLCLLTGVFSLAAFALPAGVMVSDLTGLIDPTILGIVWDTPLGTALIARVVGVLLIAICLFMTGKLGDLLGALGAVILLSSFVVSGHVASLEHLWARGVLAFHLVVAAGWIGILLPLRKLALTQPRDAAILGQKFGRCAIFLVPLMAVAGGLMASQLLASVTALITTGYGNLLLFKIIGFGVLILAAALNKIRIVPALLRGEDSAGERLARSIEVEGAAVIFVLSLTAALTSFGGP